MQTVYELSGLVAPLLALLMLTGCAKSMEKQIQDQVRTFGGASLNEAQVEITGVQESGDYATAEVRVTTAVKLRRDRDEWVIEEIRIGDRRWESAEHILAALEEKRTEATLRQMKLLQEGIGGYESRFGQVPQVDTFEELIDLISPDYQAAVIRIDAWSNPFHYRAEGEHLYDLRSSGRDGRIGSEDDLRAELTTDN